MFSLIPNVAYGLFIFKYWSVNFVLIFGLTLIGFDTFVLLLGIYMFGCKEFQTEHDCEDEDEEIMELRPIMINYNSVNCV